jgi:LmbE family N-acetylglucosaminyl deacetylase
VHERTSTAVRSFGANAPPLYYVSLPAGMMRHVVDAAVSQGWTQPKSGFWGIVPDAFGLQAAPPTITIDIKPWVARKLAALQCHRTQMGAVNPFTMIDETQACRWLGLEYFRRASVGVANGRLLEQMSNRAVGL